MDFLKQTNCLEIESTISNAVLEPEPVPPVSFSGFSCGRDTVYNDGVCIVNPRID